MENLNREYTQSRQELAELKRREEELKKLYQGNQHTDPLAHLDEETKRQYAEAAKYMAPYLKDNINPLVEEMVKSRIAEVSQQQQFEHKFNEQVAEVQSLATKWGVPFDESRVEDLAKYMEQTGSTNIVDAFEKLNRTAMIDFEIAQRKKGEKKVYSESGGKAAPIGQKPTYTGVKDKKFTDMLLAKMNAMLD